MQHVTRLMISCAVAVPVKIINPLNFCCFFVSRTVPVPTADHFDEKKTLQQVHLGCQQASMFRVQPYLHIFFMNWFCYDMPRFLEWKPSSRSAPYFSTSLKLKFLVWTFPNGATIPVFDSNFVEFIGKFCWSRFVIYPGLTKFLPNYVIDI